MTKKRITELARGDWQKGIARELEEKGRIMNPVSSLRGKAKNYSLRYQASFNNLLKRITAAGYEIKYQPGVRGGNYTATYYIA